MLKSPRPRPARWRASGGGWIVAVAMLATGFSGVAVTATEKPPVGFEELRYRISWWLIPGAEAIMQARRDGDLLFRLEACTNPALDLFHKVRDHIMVRARRSGGELRSVHYSEHIREGRYRSRIKLWFDDAGSVRLQNPATGIEKFIRVPHNTMDLITAFYALREMELTVGTRIEFPVMDAGRPYSLSVDILGSEIRSTILGQETSTIVIMPLLQAEGVFKREGAMRIWLTNDTRHLPVRVETRVAIGSIHAELTRISNDPADATEDLRYCAD